MSAVDMVETAGFVAATAANAAEAIKVLESRLDIRIVFRISTCRLASTE
jgi:hypothetical protein